MTKPLELSMGPKPCGANHSATKEENIRIYRRYIVYQRRWIRYIDKIYRLTKISVNIDDISVIMDISVIQAKY